VDNFAHKSLVEIVHSSPDTKPPSRNLVAAIPKHKLLGRATLGQAGQAGQADEQRAAEEQSAYDGTAEEFDHEEEDDETNEAGLELPEDTIKTVPDLPERLSTPPTAKTNSYLGLEDSDQARNSSSTSSPNELQPHQRRPIRAPCIYCAS
jgi:hypothetical protein